MAVNRGPYLIIGMHRSGTSLLSKILNELGFELGANLVPADAGNPDGYWEDQSIVQINREILKDSVPKEGPCWPDWGWSNSGSFQPEAPCKAATPDALAYLQHRHKTSRRGSPWGWKDPRTTLLLPFWLSLSPKAKVIAVYRQPWDTVAALHRVRPPLFLANPGWCLPIWEQYNSHLLAFAKRHPDRCLLLNSHSLAKHPNHLPLLLQQRWGIKLPAKALSVLVRSDRLQTLPFDDPLVLLYHYIFPEACRLFGELQELADLPAETALPEGSIAQKAKYLPICFNRQASKPTLAIIVPTYNQGDLLIEAIASIERQGRKFSPGLIELQIVNDGSSDVRTLTILKHLSHIGYRILHQPNLGLSAARNAGLRATTAPLVLPLDDDNYLLEAYLSPGLKIMQQQLQLAVLYGDREDFGLIEGRFRPDIKNALELWKMNRIDACALIRREWIESCGGYDESLTAFEDWDLWLGILKRGGQMGYLPLSCFSYRHRPNSMIRRFFASEQRQQETLAALRRKHNQISEN